MDWPGKPVLRMRTEMPRISVLRMRTAHSVLQRSVVPHIKNYGKWMHAFPIAVTVPQENRLGNDSGEVSTTHAHFFFSS